MTTLSDLTGPLGAIPATVGYADGITRFCLGENNIFGTCGYAGVGNGNVVVTYVNGDPQIMSDGEIEAMYGRVAQFMPTDPTTDHGSALEAILTEWETNGWVGDPTFKPLGWCQIPMGQIPAAIHGLGWAYTWCRLPLTDGNWDFSDLALRNGTPGTGPHCVTMIRSAPGVKEIVTWGERRVITDAWWAAYGAGAYAVRHPAWVRPVLADNGVMV